MLRMSLIAVLLLAIPWSLTLADETTVPLTRAEVKEIKNVITKSIDALTPLPTGYAIAEESYNIAVETACEKSTGRCAPKESSAAIELGANDKAAKQNHREATEKLAEQMREAANRGDFQSLATYQQQIAAMTMAMMAQKHLDPIQIKISLNTGLFLKIDPDSVVSEGKGFIALKNYSGSENFRIIACFDPYLLKETETLSAIDLYSPDYVEKKTSIYNMIIEIEGPEDLVSEWFSKANFSSILQSIQTVPRTRSKSSGGLG